MEISMKSRKFRCFLKIGLILLVLISVYNVASFFVQKAILSHYNLNSINYVHGTKYSILGDILDSERKSAIETCDKKLEDLYLNTTAESQGILKYKSCDLRFYSDNRLNNNHHYADLTVIFEIQDSGWLFFPLNFLTNNNTVSMVQTVKLEENQFGIDTTHKIDDIDNYSNYHNGDIISISANGTDSKEYNLKGVVNHIYTNSVEIDFEDISIDYNNLKFDTDSLKKIKR